MTLPGLARDLGEPCHPRTLRRDLDALAAIGVGVIVDKRHGTTSWRLDEGFRTFPLPVTPTELLALDALGRLSSPLQGTLFADSLTAVLRKIHAASSERTSRAFRELSAGLSIGHRPAKTYGAHTGTVDRLWQALCEGRTVRMTYDSHHSGRVGARNADPYHMRVHDNTLYLLAYCHRRKAVLVFTVDRIRALEATDRRFTLPLYFTPDDYFKDTFGIYQGKKPESVILRFDRKTARWVREKIWHRSQRLTALKGGKIRMHLTIGISPDFVAWVRSFGPDVTVEAPEGLIKRITGDAWTVAGRYEKERVQGFKGKKGSRGSKVQGVQVKH